MALTLQQQHDLLYDNEANIIKRVTVASVTFAGYLLGLQSDNAKFGSGDKSLVYSKMMNFCTRVLNAISNDNSKLFISIAQRWVAAAQAEITWETRVANCSDTLINYHIDSDVFLKMSGVTGNDYNGIPE